MMFYEIQLLSTPSIRFSCSVDIEKIKNSFDRIPNFLEFCIIEQGCSIHNNYDGTVDSLCPGMLSVITSDTACDCISVDDVRQCHTTVGVDVEYSFVRYDSERECDVPSLKERMKKSAIILVPCMEKLDKIYTKAINQIKNISSLYITGDGADRIKAIGYWYNLSALFTEYVMGKLDNIDFQPSEVLYVEKAVKYINLHYHEKITVGDISEYLEISDGYLQRIFKNIKGVTIVAYINQTRVNVALNLMEERDLSLREAGANVGIDDPAYMSRLFRNVTGMSLREYMAQQREMVRNT